jgi:hypothetical protein
MKFTSIYEIIPLNQTNHPFPVGKNGSIDCRDRIIAPIADLSAIGTWSKIQLKNTIGSGRNRSLQIEEPLNYVEFIINLEK